MVYLTFAINVLLFLSISLIFSRTFYYFGLKKQARDILSKLNIKEIDLHYSLDHMIYFIQTESANPIVKNAGRNNLYVKQEFQSVLYPSVTGLQIYIRLSGNTDILVGYLAVDQLGFPQLSELALKGQMSETELRTISAYKALNPQTQKEMLDEVYALCSQ